MEPGNQSQPYTARKEGRPFDLLTEVAAGAAAGRRSAHGKGGQRGALSVISAQPMDMGVPPPKPSTPVSRSGRAACSACHANERTDERTHDRRGATRAARTWDADPGST